MADIEFDSVDYDDMGGAPPLLSTLAMWAGGVLSLALVAGLVTWGYRITVRDMAGVPVVQALEGAIRVAPADPGGQLASHQGLAVNHVAANGGASAPPEQLQLAPRPVALSTADQPRNHLIPPAELTAAPGPDIAAPAPLSLDGTDPIVAALTAAGAMVEDTSATAVPEGGLARSVRPVPRPSGDLVARAAVAAASVAMAPARAAELAPEAVIAGTVLVQLGAFDSADEARSVWVSLTETDRFVDFFDEKMRLVQQAESGGRQFYRLRAAGFGDLADARRFCSALMAEGADCIPVVAR